jgi:hypothetical protein
MYKAMFKDSPSVWVDSGNWSAMDSPDGLVKTRTLTEAMAEMGYVSSNVSERELSNGYDSFVILRKQCKFPLVSANLVFQSTGKTIVDPYTIVTLDPKKYKALKKPLRIAIAGVTRFNPTFMKSAPPRDNVIIANPSDELKRYIGEMKKKADQVIVLASMAKDDARLLAKEVPGIDVIVGGYTAVTTAVEEKEGPTALFFTGNQGKYLGELRMFQEGGLTQIKSSLHYLSVGYPEDPPMKARVEAALIEINELGRAAAAQLAKSSSGGAGAAHPAAGDTVKPFAGVETCRTCHTADHALWAASGHAHAMQTLVDKKADFNPECVGCHVVGFKKKGGFADNATTPDMANVQCEACHGAGGKHIEDPSIPYGKAGKPSCLPCHTHENSPSFDFDTYWPRIRHGA